jgi:hypothetical protein
MMNSVTRHGQEASVAYVEFVVMKSLRSLLENSAGDCISHQVEFNVGD